MTPSAEHWPHAPPHGLPGPGTRFLTVGTFRKQLIFSGAHRLDFLTDHLLRSASLCGWRLQAWAVFPNHYHCIVSDDGEAAPMREWLRRFHRFTSRQANRWDKAQGRKVWHNYWDTPLTYPRSYLARLAYTHRNPEHHGLVARAETYRWCSAAWFQEQGKPGWVATVRRVPIDSVQVEDDYVVPDTGAR